MKDMTTQSYGGHAKNLITMQALISFCEVHTSVYSPANTMLRIDAMQHKCAEVNDMLEQVRSAKILYDGVTNAREIIFADLKKFCTRILNIAKSFGLAQQTIDDIETINRKIQGRRKTPLKKEEEKKVTTTNEETTDEEERHNKIQNSYDFILENFATLIAILSLETLYQPNEHALKVDGLNDRLQQMRIANTEVMTKATNLNRLRIERNTFLYHPKSGLVEIGTLAKQYLRGIYGTNSPQSREISSFQFYNREL